MIILFFVQLRYIEDLMVRLIKDDKQRGAVKTDVRRYLKGVQITDMIMQGNFKCTHYQQQRRNTNTE